MASAPDRGHGVAGLAAVLSTGLLAWFGTGLDPWWPLLWFAPLPVLLLATRAPWRSTAVVAVLAWLLGNLNMWHYYHSVLHVPVPIVAFLFAAEALVFLVGVLLFRVLVRGGACWTALLALPATRVSFEYLLNLTSPHGTAGSLAYTQLNFLPVLQLASLTGPWGISFLLLLVPAALAIAWHLGGTRTPALRILGACLSLIGLVLLFGAARLAQSPRGPVVKVGLIASDASQNADLADEGAPTARLFERYAAQVAALGARGPQVIVLPEKLGVVVDPDTASDELFQALADQTRVSIVVGLIHVSPPLKYNRARVYAPTAPVVNYDKHHLLPPFESKLEAGTRLTLLQQPSGTWGVAICKDMDFTPLSRRYGEAGVGLMLVPAWDFVTDRWWHGHMAVMRGVESGFAVARSAKQGYLTVSDNRGRIVAETTSDSAPFGTLLTEVSAVHEATLYVLWGDWFAWVGLGLLAFALARALRLIKAPSP
jgi:apolipoprotein N-acyltransferase